MKAMFTIIVMLTVTPIVSAIGLISFDPSNWGGELSIQSVIATAFFGLITVPLWFTFIPSLIIAPSIMSKLSHTNKFQALSLQSLIGLSLFYGALVGIIILSPPIIIVLTDSSLSSAETIKLMLNWAWAGALSGAVTLLIISLIYRRN